MADWQSPDSVEDACALAGTGSTIDGNTGTFWQHGLTEAHWIVFDLGQVCTVSKVRLYELAGGSGLERWAAGDVKVYVSEDGETWGAEVDTFTSPADGWNESNAFEKTGRYVKLVQQTSTFGFFSHMYEMEAEVTVGAQTFYKSIGGVLASSGLLSRKPTKVLAGVLTSAGEYHASPYRFVSAYPLYGVGFFVAKQARALHRNASGNRYVIGNNTSVATLQCYKSTNGGIDWSLISGGASIGGGASPGMKSPGHSVLDSQGVIHLAWECWGDQKVYYVTVDTSDDTWGSRETIEESGGPTGAEAGASIATDDDDKPHIVYVHKPGSYRGIYYRNKTGESWSDPEEVYGSAQEDEAQNPGMAVDGQGNLHVVFFTYEGDGVLKWRKRTNGVWGSIETVQTSCQIGMPSICIDSSDRPVVAFRKVNKMQVATRTGTDTWSVENPYSGEDISFLSANIAAWGGVYYLLGHEMWMEGSDIKSQGWAGRKEGGEWSDLVKIEGTDYMVEGYQFEGPQLLWGRHERKANRFEYVWWAERYQPQANDDICWSWVPYWFAPYELLLGGALASSGAVTMITTRLKAVAGTTAPSGLLGTIATRYRVLAGSLTPVGILSAVATWYRSHAGTVGLSGSLATIRTQVQPLAGTLASSGAASTISTWARTFAGTLTSSGALAAKSGKALAGALTSSGAITTVATWAQSFVGTLSPTGALVTIRTQVTAFAGSIAPTGYLASKKLVGIVYKTLQGTLTSGGGLARKAETTLSGALASSGVMTTVASKYVSVAGTLSSVGALGKKTTKALAGALTSAGAVVAKAGKALSGALSSSGAMATTLYKFITPISLGGTLSPTGAASATKLALQAMAGTLTSGGALAAQRIIGKALAGGLSASGVLARKASVAFSGTLSSAGGLVRRIGKALAGALSTVGAFAWRLAMGPEKVINVTGSVDTLLSVSASDDTLIEAGASDDTAIDVEGSL